MSARLPDFLIAGEMKCGSTTLWELLRRHPRVFLPEEKELHFFASYSYFRHHGTLETTGTRHYEEQFRDSRPEQRCGEATPNYLFDPQACERIAKTIPEVRVVAILRDPVTRAWSHYWHERRRGWEDLEILDALDAEPARMKSGDPDQVDSLSYVGRGRYIDSLERYERVLSREQLCVVFLEELRRDPASVVSRVLAHLGLELPDDLDLSLPHHNRASFPRWPALDRLTRAARRGAGRLGPGADRAAGTLGRLTRSARVYSGGDRMPDPVRARLQREFEESDRRLADWLGKPLPWRPA